MNLGENIKKARKKKGLSAKEFAKVLEIPYSTYSNYENDNREPKIGTLRKIGEALGITMAELVGYGNMGNFSAEDYKEDWGGFCQKKNKLVDHFNQLNDEGQDKAIERVEELTEIPKYKK